jgi:predicted RNA-binding Zn ribbon-like protein
MSQATGRFGLTLAPGGLRLVQELVNTALDEPQGAEDQLADQTTANAWLRDALTRWTEATGKPAPPLSLAEKDLSHVRRLREQLRQATRTQAEHLDPPAAEASVLQAVDIRLHLQPDGQVDYAPKLGGWQGVTAMVAMELLLAATNGSLPRLKSCAGTKCGVAFYDESRNQARVWHDAKVCGNAPNLRASRTRRRRED